MLVYTDPGLQNKYNQEPRRHPWGETEKTPHGRYVNFREHPELIAATLEDLRQFRQTPLEQTIISFISWANSPQSVFETNDFGLRPIRKNQSPQSQSLLELSGRVTFLFSDLKLNTEHRAVSDFLIWVRRELTNIDSNFLQACWSCCTWPHLFMALFELRQPAEGVCFTFDFWAWGNEEPEVYDNAARAFCNLQSTLEAGVNRVV